MEKIAHRIWNFSCITDQNCFTLLTDLANKSRTVADESFSGLLTVFSTCSSIETRLIFATTVGTLSASRRCWNCRIALRQQISWFDFLAWISRIRLSLIYSISLSYTNLIYGMTENFNKNKILTGNVWKYSHILKRSYSCRLNIISHRNVVANNQIVVPRVFHCLQGTGL